MDVDENGVEMVVDDSKHFAGVGDGNVVDEVLVMQLKRLVLEALEVERNLHN